MLLSSLLLIPLIGILLISSDISYTETKDKIIQIKNYKINKNYLFIMLMIVITNYIYFFYVILL